MVCPGTVDVKMAVVSSVPSPASFLDGPLVLVHLRWSRFCMLKEVAVFDQIFKGEPRKLRVLPRLRPESPLDLPGT